MRWRPIVWLLVIAAFFLGAVYLWRSGGGRGPAENISKTAADSGSRGTPARLTQHTVRSASTAPFVLFNLSPSNRTSTVASSRDPRLKYRLTNSTKTLRELQDSDQAILLLNALIDVSQPLNLAIPDSLRSKGDPGAYLVQSRGPINDAFLAQLNAAGAEIISYFPNNAYLVRADQNTANQLAAFPGTQAVIPFEPYYKLDRRLLSLVMGDEPLPPDSTLNVVAFPNREADVEKALEASGGKIFGRDHSPFGPVLRVQVPMAAVTALATSPAVQTLSLGSARAPANDLSRARVGAASDSIVPTNYMNLTGSNIIVNVNDSGVDPSNPDLTAQRVFSDVAGTLTDTLGHGTHVAGIIASSGANSSTVSNAAGSIMPAVSGQFRGMAPAASIYALPVLTGMSDFELQERAARTNARISNNSWTYANMDYDIAAASYDAAVRDSLPEVNGSQPVLYVFAAGNAGNGSDDGEGVSGGTIQSPATAKNGITVGTIEQPRGITNETQIVRNGQTNISTPWLKMTDSDTEVASFSSRGNVGVDIEGQFGRFKPDLVAPGTFVVSTRSPSWDQAAYYNPTNYHYDTFQDDVKTNSVQPYPIFLPYNTVELLVRADAIFPLVDLPVYIRRDDLPTSTTYDLRATNQAVVPAPGLPLSPVEAFWFYGVGNPTNRTVHYQVTTRYATTNDNGNYFQVLSNMNNDLGPYYRYETGTSMSAADISGMLALIEDYFSNRFSPPIAPSPALMKALLINGARTVDAGKYDLQVQKDVNDQGWGLPNLSNSIPIGLANQATTGPMLFFDQSPTNAVATGERQTIRIRINGAATNQPLRVTLVWTDPAGNPAAGIKLVNDLDLVLTNNTTKEVFFGNDIPAGSSFNFPWDTNSPPNRDSVNNVENIFLEPPIGTNAYTISVIGRRVNVNAVTGQTNRIAQDFALVISSGDGAISNAITRVTQSAGPTGVSEVTYVTNQFDTNVNSTISGQLLLNQHVGADNASTGNNTIPLGTTTIWGDAGTNGAITLGISNQWHFYVLTNTTDFTNAAFATFLPANLALPRMGVTNYGNVNESSRPEADIDLYVSKDPALLTLDPIAIAGADKSLSREGDEVVAYTNAARGDVYYVGVKSEDQQAAEYAFFGVFSLFPFSESDSNGVLVRGINVPAIIPDGSPQHPGGAQVIGIALQPVTIRRVIVTNSMSHDNMSDLFGTLNHKQQSAVLNNHSCIENLATGTCFSNVTYIYEDNGENNVPGSQPTDGPGSLVNYIGEKGQGVWTLTEVDNAFDGRTGRVDSVWIRLERQEGDGGTNHLNIAPNSFGFLSVDVPVEATNMTIRVRNESSSPLPLQLYVRHGDLPTQTVYDYTMPINPVGTNVLTINRTNLPPLKSGRYFIGIFNPNSVAQQVEVIITLDLDVSGLAPIAFASSGQVPIRDDAISYASILVTNKQKIAQAWVDLQVAHERISDMAFTLLAPSGKRFLLFENRGGTNTGGMGGGTFVTNSFAVASGGPAEQSTNLPCGTNGILIVDYQFYSVPDTMHVYYDGNLIYDTGSVSNGGTFSLSFAGASTNLTIIMNEGNNSDTNTIWDYRATIVTPSTGYLTFTEDTNFAQIPIKFAIPPFTGSNSVTLATNLPFQGLFYLPEESLTPLIGDPAEGIWRLEMWDSRAGATNFASALLSWQLRFIFEDVSPPITPLVHGVPVTNTLPECGTNYFAVDVPVWAQYATNTLLFASAPVNVWFNTNAIPTGNPAAGDVEFITGGTNGVFVVATNGVPPAVLQPGARYYLAVENPCGSGNSNVTFAIQVEFDITALTNGIPVTGTNAANIVPRYFYYDVSSNATAVSFQLTNLTGNVDLVARRGAPLPTLFSFDYGSFNPGTFDEEIIVFTSSTPVALGPGRWYLGVYNRDVIPSSYDIVAVEYTNVFPNIILLTNGIPYFNTNTPSGANSDYYEYIVTPAAARAQFEINNPSDDMTLVVRKGLPLPSLGLFDYESANLFTNDELIVLFTNSAPIPLTPGDWFLTAVNVSGFPVTYSIKATEWPVTGIPINITNIVFTPPQGTNLGSFCITWSSLPGVHYYVQGVPALGANWDIISPTITAVDYSTTYCVPLPSPYHFFRISEGIVQSTYSPLRVNVSFVPGSGFLLKWAGYYTNQYQVQWAPFLPPSWNTFTNIITSTSNSFSFLDDGSQAPFGPQRFYRVLQLP